ncbi:MAG: class I SAM-dependent methyltransferase [Cytophagales bacterium]|nr:class I SAM-dependent methyltransferase [Armatimonadota bacterium]
MSSNRTKDLSLENAPMTLACCVCGTPKASVWRVAPDHILGGETRFRAVRCLRCGTARLDPRPSDAEMSRHYTTETYARAEDRDGAPSELARRLNEYNRRLAARAAASLNRPVSESRTLDVGCGDGRFLAAMIALGGQAEGLETDPVAAALARRRTGGQIHEAPLEQASLPGASFDLVSLLHVLEHVPDPRVTLIEAKRLLKPGGTLLLALPNAGSLEASVFGSTWYPLDLPRHFWGFSPRTLARLVEECGFEAPAFRHFPLLFLPQSLRYSLSSKDRDPKGEVPASASEKGGGRTKTRVFLSLLTLSETLGRHFPGEVMEMTAQTPQSGIGVGGTR